MSEVEMARLKDKAKARSAWTDRLGLVLLTGVFVTLSGMIYSCMQAPKALPTCHNSAKIVIMHDQHEFVCSEGATMHHEKMDDFKMYVECTCK